MSFNLPLVKKKKRNCIEIFNKKLILATDNGLLVFYIFDSTSPVYIGYIPVQDLNDSTNFYVNPENDPFVINSNDIKVLNIFPEYKLYIAQESLNLGENYKENLKVLKLKNEKRYTYIDQNYKFLKMSSYTSKMVGGLENPVVTYPALPSWINFDKENGVLQLEPKLENHLGIHYLHTVFSTAVPKEAFNFIKDESDRKDLIAWLMSLGYLDSEHYLAKEFDSQIPLFLNTKLAQYEAKAHDISSQGYFQVVNSILV